MTTRRILILATLALASAGCLPQHYGASILNQSRVAVPEAYNGPVYATPGHTPAQGAAVMAKNVDRQTGPIVIADFEQNGISDGVWGTSDHNAYLSMVLMRPRCTVIVLGWRTGTPPPALETARADITEMAAARVGLGLPTVVTDWRVDVEAHPEYVHTDDVHLANQAAAVAFADRIADAKGRCP